MATIDQPIKPHVSPTQLEMIAKCPESYRRRYIEKEVIPPGIALLRGKGFHAGAETNMRQKIESREDLPVSEIVDAAVASFETEAAGGFELTDEEASQGAGKAIGNAKDGLVELATAHAEQQAPDYQPIMVEHRTRIALPSSTHDLLGIIDLADDQDRVTDFKTAKRKKSQGDADDSLQLTVYAASFRAETGRTPSELRLDSAVQTSKGVTRQVVATTRTDDDLSALANRINVVTKQIETGLFPPASPGAWWCNAKWCGYHSTCPFVNPRTRHGSQGD